MTAQAGVFSLQTIRRGFLSGFKWQMKISVLMRNAVAHVPTCFKNNTVLVELSKAPNQD